MKIKAAVAHSSGKPLQLEEVELSESGADEVLIKIVVTGVCPTDAESIKGRGKPFPAILGYKGAGIVEKVGSGVTNVQPGDHVDLSFAYCGACSQCLTGHQNLCERTVELNLKGKSKDGSSHIYQQNKVLSPFLAIRPLLTVSLQTRTIL